MTDIQQGDSGTILSQWYAYPGGPAADVSGLTITISAVDGGAVVIDGATPDHLATGVYSYEWAVGAAQGVGDYLALWEASGGLSASEIVTVTYGLTASTAWATISDVSDITGVTVTSTQLAMAHATIEAYAGRTADVPLTAFRARDLSWLRRAVCWQAAWLVDQVDYPARSGYSNFAQDGVSVAAKPEDVTLSPIAARCLRNLSWKASHTKVISSAQHLVGHPDLMDYTLEANDTRHGWEQM